MANADEDEGIRFPAPFEHVSRRTASSSDAGGGGSASPKKSRTTTKRRSRTVSSSSEPPPPIPPRTSSIIPPHSMGGRRLPRIVFPMKRKQSDSAAASPSPSSSSSVSPRVGLFNGKGKQREYDLNPYPYMDDHAVERLDDFLPPSPGMPYDSPESSASSSYTTGRFPLPPQAGESSLSALSALHHHAAATTPSNQQQPLTIFFPSKPKAKALPALPASESMVRRSSTEESLERHQGYAKKLYFPPPPPRNRASSPSSSSAMSFRAPSQHQDPERDRDHPTPTGSLVFPSKPRPTAPPLANRVVSRSSVMSGSSGTAFDPSAAADNVSMATSTTVVVDENVRSLWPPLAPSSAPTVFPTRAPFRSISGSTITSARGLTNDDEDVQRRSAGRAVDDDDVDVLLDRLLASQLAPSERRELDEAARRERQIELEREQQAERARLAEEEERNRWWQEVLASQHPAVSQFHRPPSDPDSAPSAPLRREQQERDEGRPQEEEVALDSTAADAGESDGRKEQAVYDDLLLEVEHDQDQAIKLPDKIQVPAVARTIPGAWKLPPGLAPSTSSSSSSKATLVVTNGTRGEAARDDETRSHSREEQQQQQQQPVSGASSTTSESDDYYTEASWEPPAAVLENGATESIVREEQEEEDDLSNHAAARPTGMSNGHHHEDGLSVIGEEDEDEEEEATEMTRSSTLRPPLMNEDRAVIDSSRPALPAETVASAAGMGRPKMTNRSSSIEDDFEAIIRSNVATYKNSLALQQQPPHQEQVQ